MQLLQHLNTAVKYQKSKKEGPYQNYQKSIMKDQEEKDIQTHFHLELTFISQTYVLWFVYYTFRGSEQLQYVITSHVKP